MIGTLAVDGWAVTVRRGLGGAAARPGPSSSVLSRHIFFGGGNFPPNFEFPPQELEARSVYYVNVSLLSVQN